MSKSTNGTTVTKSLIPAISVNQFKPLTEKECIAQKLPSTSKSKARMGIENDREIVWAPVNMDVVTHGIVMAVCKKHEITIWELFAKVGMQWIVDNIEQLTEEADGYTAEAMTEEVLQKKLEAAQRQLARTQALLDSFKK